MMAYSGPITIDDYQAIAQFFVTTEWADETVGVIGAALRRPRYSWSGTIHLSNPTDAPELLLGWPGGERRTIVLPDGRFGQVIQKSLDSDGVIEVVGVERAPWVNEGVEP
jgi:hypothetical protein